MSGRGVLHARYVCALKGKHTGLDNCLHECCVPYICKYLTSTYKPIQSERYTCASMGIELKRE